MTFIKAIFDQVKGLYQVTVPDSGSAKFVMNNGTFDVGDAEIVQGGENLLKDGVIPSSGSDGAYHLYVSVLSGSDANDGLTSATSFRTIQGAIDRGNRWIRRGEDKDLVIEVASGTYAEDVKCILSQIPKRRIIIRGDINAQTVVVSGTVVSGNNTEMIDTAATFGNGTQLVGLTLHMYDGANRANTERWATIASHTNTAIRAINQHSGGPSGSAVGGWVYEVVRPAVSITGDGSGQTRQASFLGVMPWGSSMNRSVDRPIPKLFMAWLQIDNTDSNADSVDLEGGYTRFIGCIFGGTNGSLTMRKAIVGGGYGAAEADPVFDITANNLTRINGARWATMPTTSTRVGLNVLAASFIDNGFVSTAGGGVICRDLSKISLSAGSAIYSGSMQISQLSFLDVFASAAGQRNLFKGMASTLSGAITALNNSVIEQTSTAAAPMEFEDVACTAIRTDDSLVSILGTVAANNLTGRMFDAQRSGRVEMRDGNTLAQFHQSLSNPQNFLGHFVVTASAHDQTSVNSLLNNEKARINLHLSSSGSETPHAVGSAAQISSSNASDLATSITLANEIKSLFNTHRTEASVHVNNDPFNVVSSPNAADLQTAIDLANEIRQRYNSHAIDLREIRCDGPQVNQGLASGSISVLGAGSANSRTAISGGTTNSRAWRRIL